MIHGVAEMGECTKCAEVRKKCESPSATQTGFYFCEVAGRTKKIPSFKNMDQKKHGLE